MVQEGETESLLGLETFQPGGRSVRLNQLNPLKGCAPYSI